MPQQDHFIVYVYAQKATGTMRYLPKLPCRTRHMLTQIGADSDRRLCSRRSPSNSASSATSRSRRRCAESEIVDWFRARAAESGQGYASSSAPEPTNHYRPVVIDSLISRGEWFTAYTPYQPEIAQGTLQSIFEFQTMICELTGMEVANASHV